MELASERKSDQQDNVNWEREWLVYSVLEELSLICLTSLITLMILKMKRFVLEKKNYLKKGLSSSPNLKWVSYIVSVELPPRELAP